MRILGKIIKFFGNFVGVILSLALSVALLGMLIATPMLTGVSAFTRPETISQVAKEIDFAQFFLDSFQGELSEEERLEMEFIVELTGTNAFDDLVELYAIDISNLFEETQKPSVLTKEALRKIVQDNIDEILLIVREIGEGEGDEIASYTDAELEAKVWEAFDELADKFLEMAPTVDDLRNLIGKFAEEFTTDSSDENERPNSSAQPGEETYDTPVYEFGGEEYEGGSTIVHIPGEGGTVTIIGPDGNAKYEDGVVSYYVDENGNVVFIGGEGGTATSNGGTLTFGKAVAIRNGTVRVLLMSIAPSGGAQEDAEQEEIVDTVLKLARMAKNGTLTLLLVGAIVVLALLICLFRWPRFKGIMWVAVILLIGAVFVALAGVAYKILPGIIAEQGGQSVGIIAAVNPAIKIIANSMFVAAGIYAGVAIVLIVLFAVFRKMLRKQKAAKAEAVARAASIEEIAAEAEESACETCEEVPAEELAESEDEAAEAEEVLPAEVEFPTEEENVPAEEELPAE